MSKYEEHVQQFLKVRNILSEQKDFFALAKAYKKPFKWYGKYSVADAVKILKKER